MKKLFSIFIAISILVIGTVSISAKEMDSYDVEQNKISPFISVDVSSEKAQKLNVSADENSQYFISGNELICVKSKLNQQHLQSYSDNPLNTSIVIADISVGSINLTKNEKEELLYASSAISPRSGSLIKVEQAMDGAACFRLTLTVTYSSGFRGLHLCKATGTFQLVSPGGGIRALSSNLYWNVVGQKYVNSIHESNTSMGNSQDFTAPVFSNQQLMPENVSFKNHTDAGVAYTLYGSRGVTVTAIATF